MLWLERTMQRELAWPMRQDDTQNRETCHAFKFANNKNESDWETLAQCRLIARICALFKAYTGRRAWKAIGDRLLKRCYLSRDGHTIAN